MLYANRCSLCHGDQAYASGLTPNLRFSPSLGDKETWSAILVDGLLVDNGMPNFEGLLSDDDVEAIRAYVIEEANNGLGKEFYDSDLKSD